MLSGIVICNYVPFADSSSYAIGFLDEGIFTGMIAATENGDRTMYFVEPIYNFGVQSSQYHSVIYSKNKMKFPNER